MTITASIVLFAIFWFILLFVTLPIKIKTQQETGKQTPGTPPSAPEDPQIKTKMLWVTVVAFCLWIIAMVSIYLIFLN
jgi:predicted secreted protein